MYRHILVPTGGSTVSGRAERAAVQIARRFHSEITAVYATAALARVASDASCDLIVMGSKSRRSPAPGKRRASAARG